MTDQPEPMDSETNDDGDESPFRPRPPLSNAEAIDILSSAEIEVLGRMPYSSNATFLVDLNLDGAYPAQAIYKPERGEQPLWDFPGSLFMREIAAFVLSEQLGWGHVPPTIEVDGPAGIGSLQLFVPANFEEHYFTILDDVQFHQAFREICAFDFVANNTDRKAGHILLDDENELWCIDNSLCFHQEFKLRTVVWDFAGEQLPDYISESLQRFLDDGLSPELAELLTAFEGDATLTRARALLQNGEFPSDPTGRRYPWPMV